MTHYDPDVRGPSLLEGTAEAVAADLEVLPPDGSGTYTEPLAVYRYAEGGSIPARAYCGACIVLAGSDVDTRAIGARTAARCEACGQDGAPARWSEALRGAAYWRALVVGLRASEADLTRTYQTWTGAEISAAIHDGAPGVPVRIEHTGGGCATVYAGEPTGPDDDQRFPLVIGPGWYDGERGARFDSDDCYAGPDDDGATDPAPVRSLNALRIIARRTFATR